jgi:hypothetical protein
MHLYLFCNYLGLSVLRLKSESTLPQYGLPGIESGIFRRRNASGKSVLPPRSGSTGRPKQLPFFTKYFLAFALKQTRFIAYLLKNVKWARFYFAERNYRFYGASYHA